LSYVRRILVNRFVLLPSRSVVPPRRGECATGGSTTLLIQDVIGALRESILDLQMRLRELEATVRWLEGRIEGMQYGTRKASPSDELEETSLLG